MVAIAHVRDTMYVAFFAALLAVVSGNAAGNSWGLDRSDTWWDPNESGWGVQMTQQQNTIVMSFFIYGADRRPTWISGALLYDGSGYQGQLVESTGPYHLGPFNPSTVTRQVVGFARLDRVNDHVFSLTYTVGGVTVTKTIRRLTFASNSLAGSFYGGLVGYLSGCGSLNGYLVNIADMTITHTGSNILVTGLFENNRGGRTTCAFAGIYRQYGRIGEADGTFNCTDGDAGPFSLRRIEVTEDGILATASSRVAGCQFEGRFGAVKNN